MTWLRALRRTLGFIAGMAVGALLALGGILIGASWEHATVVEQGQRLDDNAARKCIYLTPAAPRHP